MECGTTGLTVNNNNPHEPEPVSFRYSLEGQIVPKQRPRHNGRQAYLPQRYREWKRDAIAELIIQSRGIQCLDSAEVEIALLGKHRLNSDLDNLAGSVLDALVGAGIIRDDCLKVVSRLVIAYQPETKMISTEIVVRAIAPCR